MQLTAMFHDDGPQLIRTAMCLQNFLPCCSTTIGASGITIIIPDEVINRTGAEDLFSALGLAFTVPNDEEALVFVSELLAQLQQAMTASPAIK